MRHFRYALPQPRRRHLPQNTVRRPEIRRRRKLLRTILSDHRRNARGVFLSGRRRRQGSGNRKSRKNKRKYRIARPDTSRKRISGHGRRRRKNTRNVIRQRRSHLRFASAGDGAEAPGLRAELHHQKRFRHALSDRP
ncbi:MAG: hypothetical protein BWY32_03485 [bacterium ADurb.Bin243]|nr:MAG: hypothetical protein BWY32_03485 [bacterium ADurb.Bin243]